MLIIAQIRKESQMSKAQELEDMQEFIDEYENIKETLESLIDDTNNKELKQEINELLSVFEEDYQQQKEDFEARVYKLENEECQALAREYDLVRL